ncbi:carbon storage regulator [Geosporobacter ferrireducens]|uniref:carbon storage regulator n=1 Tax=Geosporobacter ferrireducens TaxID=1424294 RepID=UPI00139D4838|nr:carbon storage regulator [Geosporobacter ferrireducens]MTI55726.1 carbon storage regulator [Geosporobacter ferrireducens]
MLITEIKDGECAMIGDNIRIHIVKNKKRDIRLAIDAPKHLPIKRGECIEKNRLPNFEEKKCWVE